MGLDPEGWEKELSVAQRVNTGIKVSNKAVGGEYNCSNNALQCVKCKNIFPLFPCSNCDCDIWVGVGGNVTKGDGIKIMCGRCDEMVQNWTCDECGTRNPINTTILKKKEGGCFVATAAFNTPLAKEVKMLSAFRDTYLMRYMPGRVFVSLYYSLSPSIASVIQKRDSLRVLVRLILTPVVLIAYKIQRQRRGVGH